MQTSDTNAAKPSKQIDVVLLALDLSTCSRCVGTANNLRTAISLVSDLFRELGTEVVYHETVVATAEQAVRLRLRSSPTVRINGRELAVELRESPCKDCGELCACGDGMNCQVWLWNGVEHLEAPIGLLLDALLKEYAQIDPSTKQAIRPFSLPENLRAFFSARDPSAKQENACCDETVCCEPSDKAACCGQDSAAPSCGCR
jgi:hypothetical protein